MGATGILRCPAKTGRGHGPLLQGRIDDRAAAYLPATTRTISRHLFE